MGTQRRLLQGEVSWDTCRGSLGKWTEDLSCQQTFCSLVSPSHSVCGIFWCYQSSWVNEEFWSLWWQGAMYYVPGLILELTRTRELPDHCQISVRRTEHPTRQERESRTLSQVDRRAGGCLSDLSRSAHTEQDVKWEFSCCIIGRLKAPCTSHSTFRPTAAARPATTHRV